MDPLSERREIAPGGMPTLDGTLAAHDGMAYYWRAIRPDDTPRLQAFHLRLSHRSLIFRFFGEMPTLSRELAERLSHVDYQNRMALVVTPSPEPDAPIVAVARYERTEPQAAEFALVIEDRLQGQGIGPQLLEALASYARQQGFAELIANVMYENDRMLAMLRRLPYPSAHHPQSGHVEIRLDISGADTATDHAPDPEQHAPTLGEHQ